MGGDTRDIVVPTTSGYKTVDTNRPFNDPPAVLSGVKNKTVREIVISSVVMLCVALSWALSTQFGKTALNFKESFYAPYFLVWFGTMFMMSCYPAYLIYACIRTGLNQKKLQDLHEEATLIYGQSSSKLIGYFTRTTLFLVFWTGANYSYSQSLGHISASAASSLMSSNVAIVCILGWIFLHDKFIPFRLVAIAAAIGGVVVMSLDKEFAGSTLGICLSLLSAFLAAIYKVLFKKVIGDATLGQVSLFMSGLGLLNTFVNAIPVFALMLTKAENVQWSEVPWLPLVGSAVLSLLFNFLLNFGVALLHPLVISVGMLLGIPISAGVDIVVRHMHATHYFIIGAFLILLSCVLIILPFHQMFSCRKKRTDDIEPGSRKF